MRFKKEPPDRANRPDFRFARSRLAKPPADHPRGLATPSSPGVNDARYTRGAFSAFIASPRGFCSRWPVKDKNAGRSPLPAGNERCILFDFRCFPKGGRNARTQTTLANRFAAPQHQCTDKENLGSPDAPNRTASE